MTDVNGYDPMGETYRVGFDWPGPKPPSVALVEAMAAVTDTDPANLDVLYGTIDPNALDDMFAHSAGASKFDGCVKFTYCDHEITVEADEIVIDLSNS